MDIRGSLKIPAGAAASDVLTSSSTGVATWQAAAGGGATSDWISVVTYGADPTGATDSSAAIQSAIQAAQAVTSDSALATGAVVYFPAGSYTVGTQIQPTANKPVNLVGAGQDSTVVTCAVTTTGGALFFYEWTGAQIFGIRDMQFKNTSSGDIMGIDNTNVTDGRFPQFNCERVKFVLGSSNTAGMALNGVFSGSGSSNVLSDSLFYRCGFYYNGTTDRSSPAIKCISNVAGGISNVTFDKCDFNNGPGSGDASDNTQFFVILGCSKTYSYAVGISFKDCRWQSCYGGSFQGQSVKAISFENNVFWDLGVSGASTLGNSILSFETYPSGSGGCNGIRIVNCERDLGGPNGTSTWDVQFDANCSQILIENYVGAQNTNTTQDNLYFNFGSCSDALVTSPIVPSSTLNGSSQVLVTSPAVNMRFAPDLLQVLASNATISTTGVANVSGMSTALAPGKYQITVCMPYTAAASAGTHSYNWTFSGTATGSIACALSGGAAQESGGSATLTTTFASGTQSTLGGYDMFDINMTVTVAGTLQLQGKVSVAADTCTILAGACIEVMRIG